MKIVEDIKGILSKHYEQMKIYDLIGELDTEDDMSFDMEEGETNVRFSHEGYEIEVKLTTHYNHNKGFITLFKDEDLQEVIPFNYVVES